MNLYLIFVAVTLDTIVVFVKIAVFFVPVVALLTSLPII
jgi:hypothetical protein